MHFLFYRISSCLFFGDATDCFPSRRRILFLLLKKPESSSNPHLHLICHSGFESVVIFVTLYSFLMHILCDQLFIPIAVFSLRKTYLTTDLSVHALLSLLYSFHLLLLVVCFASYARSTFLLRSFCDQKKITPYRIFFRNLSFNNVVNFFKRAGWYKILFSNSIYINPYFIYIF